MTTHTCQMFTPSDNFCKHYIPDDPMTPEQSHPGFCSLPSRYLCEEKVKECMPRQSYSSIHTFMRCRQKYYLHYYLGLRKRDNYLPEPVKAGALWDAWLSGKSASKEINRLAPMDITVAKVKALVRAAKELGLKPTTGTAQLKISYPICSTNIIGYIDRAYDDHFDEDKLSARPDFYTKRQNIEHQVGTYFMAEPRFLYVDVKAVRMPQTRTGSGKYSDESMESYTNRVYSDIAKRPSFFFPGLNRIGQTYGTRFHRGEFDLDGLFRIYVAVIKEIESTARKGGDAFYPNTTACYCPGECEYVNVCANGVVSDEVFYYEEPKQSDQNMKGGE